MSPAFLLDTNALSEPLKPHPDPGFLKRLRAHEDAVAISSITWHEALYGCYRLAAGRRRAAVEEYLHNVIAPNVPILPYDEAAAQWHAAQRARLGARGRLVPFADGQIAAVAAVHGLAIVTANIKDFEPFTGVHVECWWED